MAHLLEKASLAPWHDTIIGGWSRYKFLFVWNFYLYFAIQLQELSSSKNYFYH